MKYKLINDGRYSNSWKFQIFLFTWMSYRNMTTLEKKISHKKAEQRDNEFWIVTIWSLQGQQFAGKPRLPNTLRCYIKSIHIYLDQKINFHFVMLWLIAKHALCWYNCFFAMTKISLCPCKPMVASPRLSTNENNNGKKCCPYLILQKYLCPSISAPNRSGIISAL